MTKTKRISAIAAISALALTPIFTLNLAAQSPRAKEIGMHIKCMCKGCDMTAGGCAHPGGSFSGPCDTAIAEMKEIDEHLAQGQSEQQIIDSFIAKYGTIAYVEPPKHGFGLVAWLMPFFYTFFGLAIVVSVVKKWSSRKPAVADADTHGISREALEHARARAARDTED
jgi:cytochrome c-type biogenesis protein CcmH/NrfF